MISVVVCTYNGADRISGTLAALAQQQGTYPYEVLVVDDGSTDGVGAVIDRFDVQRISLGRNVGLSAARNAGIAAASGSVIAFCDDDCRPGPTWVADLAAVWDTAGDDVHGIGGEVEAAERDTIARRYAQQAAPLRPLEHDNDGNAGVSARLRRYVGGMRPRIGRRSVASLVGANMSFRAGSLRECGGFDPVITFGGDEEAVCRNLRIRYGSACLIVEPSIVMPHSYHPHLRDTFRRAVAYGCGSGREWVRNGGIPSLRPGFWFVAVGCIGAIGVWIVAGMGCAVGVGVGVCGVVPAVLWRGQLHGKEAERFVYPYLSLLLEGANTYGFWQGWWRVRQGV